MSEVVSQPDGNTPVLPQPTVDVEVISLNVEELDVEELEHRLELASPIIKDPGCVILAEWAL